jgi:DNA invertase Pin-like site-specific DNA recombinase
LGRYEHGFPDELFQNRSQCVGFISFTENIDIAMPDGKLNFHLMEALAEFEWDLI